MSHTIFGFITIILILDVLKMSLMDIFDLPLLLFVITNYSGKP